MCDVEDPSTRSLKATGKPDRGLPLLLRVHEVASVAPAVSSKSSVKAKVRRPDDVHEWRAESRARTERVQA